jgi:hypothetical protein
MRDCRSHQRLESIVSSTAGCINHSDTPSILVVGLVRDELAQLATLDDSD